MATEPDRDLTTTVTAPAKLTTSLRVVDRRADGYHLLDAEMVSIDLVDELEIAEPEEGASAGISIELVAPGDAPAAGQLPELPDRPRLSVPLGRDNLIHRALRSVDHRAHVRLVKRIPPGAGLGGGSSDAAAVLRWAGCDDLELAASLGADVPFCLRGGRARVTGIGEVLTALPFEPRTYTLLVPPFGCSTPAVYRAWDDLDGGGRLEEGADPGGNDLQAAALAVEPRLAAWRDKLAQASGRTPRLAGSGSTWFVEGAFPGDERVVVKTVPGSR